MLTDRQQLAAAVASDISYYYNPNRTLDHTSDYTGVTQYTEFQDGTEKSVQLPGQSQPQLVTSINSGTEDPTGVTNPNGSTSSQNENTLGQTTTRSGAGIIASKLGYNADGQLNTLTTYPGGDPTNTGDAGAATTTWGYDPATGLMTGKSYNDGTGIDYKYNPAGQLKSMTEPGMSASFGYNAAGQQTSYTATDTAAGLVSSQIQAMDDQGRPMVTTSVDNGQVAAETNTYTALGQPQTESFGAAQNVTVAHGYYPLYPGQHDPSPATESPVALASMTIQNLPNGQANAQTSYGYDPVTRRLQTITVNGVTFTIGYVTNSPGQIASITTTVAGQTGTALTTTFATDALNASRLGGITATTGVGTTLYGATAIGYNQNNQIGSQDVTSVDPSGNPQTNNYVYTYGSGTGDNSAEADSLTKVTDNGTATETYAYDGVGNFLDSGLGDANALNQYSALSYNLRGDVLDDGTYAYTYDANDRMISVTPHDTAQSRLTFGYDSQGRRIWKNVYTWNASGGAWVLNTPACRTYVYDGTQLVGELDSTGKLVTGYTWSPSGQLLAVTDYSQPTPKTYVAAIDASGNTAMLVDPIAGTVAASYTYDSYGNLLTASGPAEQVCSILGKGLYYDIEARTIGHALNRDVRQNVWLERDPAGELAGGANLYQYLGGDPIDLSDTSGAAPESDQSMLSSAWQDTKYFFTHPLTYTGLSINLAYAVQQNNFAAWVDSAQMLHQAVSANYTSVQNEWKLADQATAQGSANALNGTVDVGANIANTPDAVYHGVAWLFGSDSHIYVIVVPDFSRDAVLREGDTAHAASKFIGGNGVVLALTAGGGSMLSTGSSAARALSAANTTLNFANGTASGLNAINDFRAGRNGSGAANAGASALNFAAFYFGIRGIRSPERPLQPGDAGRFSELENRAVVGDGLTPHHMPQAALGFTSRADGGAIMLLQGEHVLTRTYGFGGAQLAIQEANLPFRTVLARDIRDLRSLPGVGSKYNDGLQGVVAYYRIYFPKLISK